MQFDLYHGLLPVQSIAPQAVTGAVNGTGVDLSGFLGALVEINLGNFAGTDPTATIKIQESDDGTTYTDVSDADLIGGSGTLNIDANSAAQVYRSSYIGTRRYLRVIVSAVGGTSPSLPMAATIIKGRPRHAPVS